MLTNGERRLTIALLGAASILALLAVAYLAAVAKPIPDVLASVAVLGLGILTPSPLSKSTVAPDTPVPMSEGAPPTTEAP